TLIWSFHVHSYCVQPDCNVRHFGPYLLSKSWPTVLFGTPKEAREALQRDGLNYFFYSHDLAVSDLLLNAALFSPDEIADNLAIAWTDGANYLLTWPGPDTRSGVSLECLAAQSSFQMVQRERLARYCVSHRSKTRKPAPLCAAVDNWIGIGASGAAISRSNAAAHNTAHSGGTCPSQYQYHECNLRPELRRVDREYHRARRYCLRWQGILSLYRESQAAG
ncbi:MAG TPA: hypothetical protein VKB96_06680, partial [Gammaproteobacteria bacterium]|nr:hypothetical protein [Gammaproteobacteria bacterium]